MKSTFLADSFSTLDISQPSDPYYTKDWCLSLRASQPHQLPRTKVRYVVRDPEPAFMWAFLIDTFPPNAAPFVGSPSNFTMAYQSLFHISPN